MKKFENNEDILIDEECFRISLLDLEILLPLKVKNNGFIWKVHSKKLNGSRIVTSKVLEEGLIHRLRTVMQPQRRAVMLYMELDTAAKIKPKESNVPGINHNNGLVFTKRIVQAISYSN